MAALHLSSPRQSELRSSSVSLQDEVPFDPKVGFFLHSPLDPETTSCRALGNLGWFSYRVSPGEPMASNTPPRPCMKTSPSSPTLCTTSSPGPTGNARRNQLSDRTGPHPAATPKRTSTQIA